MNEVAERLKLHLDAAYQLSGPLGEGGMGLVFRARDVRLERDVAIKVLHGALAREPEFRERFIREARTLALISHPHVLPIHYCSAPDAEPMYLVTELVDGPSLARWLSDHGPLPWEVALALVERCLAGLAAAHAKDILHRDIKPGNILISAQGAPKLADFGVARALDATTLTSGDSVVGTLRYIAPEALDEPARSTSQDVYAMGCVLFEALAGVPAFPQSGMGAMVHAIAVGAVPQLDRLCPNVWPEAVPVVEASLAREPAERYATAEAMRIAIAEVLEGIGCRDPGGLCAGYFTAPDRDAFLQAQRARTREHLFERANALSFAGRDVEAVELANRLPLLDHRPAAVSPERALQESRTAPTHSLARPLLRQSPRPLSLSPVARFALVVGALALAPLDLALATNLTIPSVYLLGPVAFLTIAALLAAARPTHRSISAGAFLGALVTIAWQPGEARTALPHALTAIPAALAIGTASIARRSLTSTLAIAAAVPLLASAAATLAAHRVALARLEEALTIAVPSPAPLVPGLGFHTTAGPAFARAEQPDCAYIALDVPLDAPFDPALAARLSPYARRLVLMPWFPRKDGRSPDFVACVDALLNLISRVPASTLLLPEELSIAPSTDTEDPPARMAKAAAALHEKVPHLKLGVSDELSQDEELPSINIQDVASWADQPWVSVLALPSPKTPNGIANTERLVTALSKRSRSNILWLLSAADQAPGPRAPWHAVADRALITQRVRAAKHYGAAALIHWPGATAPDQLFDLTR